MNFIIITQDFLSKYVYKIYKFNYLFHNLLFKYLIN